MKLWVYEYLSAGGAAVDDDGLLAQGLAMRDALATALARVPGVALQIAAASDEPPVERVRREAARHDAAWIVAPESDGLLARLCDAVAPERWIGCDAPSIRLASSKRSTVEHLARSGLPTPLAYLRSANAWVVKPDDGAGTLETRRHASLADARLDVGRRLQAGLASTLEPWVDGEPLSLSLLADGQGEAELLAVNRQQIATDADGTLRYLGVRTDVLPAADARRRRLAGLAAQVARAIPGLRGYVGIDLVWHPQHGPVVIEVNPRLTCAFVGVASASGRNVAAEILALHHRLPAHA